MSYKHSNSGLWMAGLLILVSTIACSSTEESRSTWSQQQANEWYKNYDWMVGANFNPSTAINQLETWQAETFDSVTIDRELGWAEDLGMNVMRVYLHHVAWQQDPDGFISRMDQYLKIADSHGIKTMFVFFDDCWNPVYEAGSQPEPNPESITVAGCRIPAG